MIELYRREKSAQGERIEGALKELRAAHKVIIVELGQEMEAPLPAIRDGGEWFSGKDAIAEYLEKLEDLLSTWTWFAGDACYIDEDGEVC
jgi:hypothetical protein